MVLHKNWGLSKSESITIPRSSFHKSPGNGEEIFSADVTRNRHWKCKNEELKNKESIVVKRGVNINGFEGA